MVYVCHNLKLITPRTQIFLHINTQLSSVLMLTILDVATNSWNYTSGIIARSLKRQVS